MFLTNNSMNFVINEDKLLQFAGSY